MGEDEMMSKTVYAFCATAPLGLKWPLRRRGFPFCGNNFEENFVQHLAGFYKSVIWSEYQEEIDE